MQDLFLRFRLRRVVPVFTGLLMVLGLLLAVRPCGAQTSSHAQMVKKILAEQPHWMEPLITPTGLLTEGIRINAEWGRTPGLLPPTMLGGGKSTILPHHMEITNGLPFATHSVPGTPLWPLTSAVLKDRLLAANETHGDYVVTTFLGVTHASSSGFNTAPNMAMTPGLALGKGWGKLDIQAAFSVGFLERDYGLSGHPVSGNVAVQLHLFRYFWPEVELNEEIHPPRDVIRGEERYITPGFMVGSIRLSKSISLDAGSGYQIPMAGVLGGRGHVVATTVLHF